MWHTMAALRAGGLSATLCGEHPRALESTANACIRACGALEQ